MVKFPAAEIMSQIWMKRTKVQLALVGKDPTSDVHAGLCISVLETIVSAVNEFVG